MLAQIPCCHFYLLSFQQSCLASCVYIYLLSPLYLAMVHHNSLDYQEFVHRQYKYLHHTHLDISIFPIVILREDGEAKAILMQIRYLQPQKTETILCRKPPPALMPEPQIQMVMEQMISRIILEKPQIWGQLNSSSSMNAPP